MVLSQKMEVLKPKPYSADFVRFSTLGFWPAAVDWMWIQTLQIIGERQFPSELKPFAVSFYELATDVDPHFYELYEQAAVTFGFLFKSPDDSIYFLEKGVSKIHPRWTHPYTLYLFLAYYYAYEKKNWLKAKESYLKASELPGSPAYLQRMKKWLEVEGSEIELARRVLIMMIKQTDDQFLKAEYQKKLESL